jgi:hypothetical protein
MGKLAGTGLVPLIMVALVGLLLVLPRVAIPQILSSPTPQVIFE